jgi:hypothetical protein
MLYFSSLISCVMYGHIWRIFHSYAAGGESAKTRRPGDRQLISCCTAPRLMSLESVFISLPLLISCGRHWFFAYVKGAVMHHSLFKKESLLFSMCILLQLIQTRLGVSEELRDV